MQEIQLKVGDVAPDFTLKNQHEEEIKLSSLKGKKVLLSFHPLAWTSVCEIQMRALALKQDEFNKLNTIAIGISVDSVPSKKEWANYMNIKNTHLLADFWPHGNISKKYDLFLDNVGISGRANILINEQGKIELIRVYKLSEIPDIEDIIKFIKK